MKFAVAENVIAHLFIKVPRSGDSEVGAQPRFC